MGITSYKLEQQNFLLLSSSTPSLIADFRNLESEHWRFDEGFHEDMHKCSFEYLEYDKHGELKLNRPQS